MAFRCIMITGVAHISVRNSQLVIRTDAEHSLPLEDISAVLLESRQRSITTAALSLMGQRGCAVYFCDEKHLPCAVLLPYNQHSRTLTVLQTQLNATQPLKKRLWQSIVREKIRNQAACLRIAGQEAQANTLLAMADRVRSGDEDNVEASAAQYYFPALFGEGFTRSEENGINAGLNYGYAILRGCIARSLAVYGFQPALGLHHRSALNSFNLADDLIEPYRPLIDLLVLRNIAADDGLSPTNKQLLFNCLNLDILLKERHHSVSYAIELSVQSLGRALSERNASLDLPTLIELDQHRYE